MSHTDPPRDDIPIAALAAHQMKGPVASAAMMLKTLLGQYSGPLSPQQEETLRKALARCDQAMEAADRMLAIARAQAVAAEGGASVDVSRIVRRAELRFAEEARRRDMSFAVQTPNEPCFAGMEEASLIEVLDAVLSNALKYTPDQGLIRVRVTRADEPGHVQVRVADSGVGIPESDREKVFEPFFRSSRAVGSSRPGSGLGLAFVRSMVEASGGKVWIASADLGGTEVVLELPAVEPADSAGWLDEAGDGPRLKVVIIGGAVAGPKAASKIVRLRPDAEVTLIEKSPYLSVAGCGLPYYMAGVVREVKELVTTPAGNVRDPIFFQNVKHVRVLNQTEATAIDRRQKLVMVRDLPSGRESALNYDKLVLAMGSTPVESDLPGADLDSVVSLYDLASGERLKSRLDRGGAQDVVIAGGGIIGVEITESLLSRGCRVTLVEKRPQIMHTLDWELAALVARFLESKGIRIHAGASVQAFEKDGTATRVVTDRGVLTADVVIKATGFRPNTRLARAAGLTLGPTGGIQVDEYLCTSDPDIYAAGDCIESRDLITGQPRYFPYGSLANRQGRCVAINACGGAERFPGVLGTAVCKVFEWSMAWTGMNEREAIDAGYDVVCALVPAPDRAPYMPNAKMLQMKIVVDRQTRRLLGAQAVGPGMGEKRIDLAAMAITGGLTIDQIANADLSYAPAYGPVLDNLATAANVVRNKLDGAMPSVTPMEVQRMLASHKDFVFLDVRTPAEYEQVRLPGSTLITLGTLRNRLDELPRDKEIVTFCKQSLRGYEAAIVLRAAGFDKVRVMDGGIEMWPYERIR